MKHVIVGTNRPNSRTRKVADIVQNLYRDLGEEVGMIDLGKLPYPEITGDYGNDGLTKAWREAVDIVTGSEGLIIVVPEYNGSYPGALKYFVDHWKYPESFEGRPMCFIGLGGIFGGLRPVEHLQQVMGYRNAFQFPQRIFLMNIFKTLQDGELKDPVANELLKNQAIGFQKFVRGLQGEMLDANSILKSKETK